MTQTNEMDETIVRLSLPAYNAMIMNMEKLKAQARDADAKQRVTYKNLIAEQSKAHQAKMLNSAQVKADSYDKQLRVERSHKAQLEGQILDLQFEVATLKDAANTFSVREELKIAEQRIRNLEAEIETVLFRQATEKSDEEKALSDALAQKEQELLELGAQLRAKGRKSEQDGQLLQHVTAERDQLLEAQENSRKGSANKELTATVSRLNQEIKGLREELANAKNDNTFLKHQCQKVAGNPSQTARIAELEAKFKKEQAENGRLRNNLLMTTKRLEAEQARSDRLGKAEATVRGAAHLITPAANAKLPKTVFDCIHCYVKNLDCDSGARCENCTSSGLPCTRWRCSMKHLLGNCPDTPCHFLHDEGGWLITKQGRPKW
jgi:predicted  nucleic acid-binding Zn-ribbon protein